MTPTSPSGPTYAISVGSGQTTAIAVAPTQGNSSNVCEFYNSGATEVCVVLAPWASSAATPALVFPAAGTPTIPQSFMLPHAMQTPRRVTVPANGFCVSAIGSATGPSIIYITPLASNG